MKAFLPGKDIRTGQKTNIAEGLRFVNRLCRKKILIAKNPGYYYNLDIGGDWLRREHRGIGCIPSPIISLKDGKQILANNNNEYALAA